MITELWNTVVSAAQYSFSLSFTVIERRRGIIGYMIQFTRCWIHPQPLRSQLLFQSSFLNLLFNFSQLQVQRGHGHALHIAGFQYNYISSQQTTLYDLNLINRSTPWGLLCVPHRRLQCLWNWCRRIKCQRRGLSIYVVRNRKKRSRSRARTEPPPLRQLIFGEKSKRRRRTAKWSPSWPVCLGLTQVTGFVVSWSISTGWPVDVGLSSSHTARWSSQIFDTVRMLSPAVFGHPDNSRPWTCLTVWHRTNISLCFFHKLSSGMAAKKRHHTVQPVFGFSLLLRSRILNFALVINPSPKKPLAPYSFSGHLHFSLRDFVIGLGCLSPLHYAFHPLAHTYPVHAKTHGTDTLGALLKWIPLYRQRAGHLAQWAAMNNSAKREATDERREGGVEMRGERPKESPDGQSSRGGRWGGVGGLERGINMIKLAESIVTGRACVCVCMCLCVSVCFWQHNAPFVLPRADACAQSGTDEPCQTRLHPSRLPPSTTLCLTSQAVSDLCKQPLPIKIINTWTAHYGFQREGVAYSI